MRTVNRRELNHRSAQVIDAVLATGEPVEVVSRGKGSVIISRKPQSQYDAWVEQGVVIPAQGRLDQAPTAESHRSVAAILADVRGDH